MKYDNTIAYNPSSSYYVRGICYNGSRHYSEDMSYKDAIAAMSKYEGVVEYFGGGVVELIEVENVVSRKVVG